TQLPGRFGVIKITPRRPFAGLEEIFIGNGPHIGSSASSLMTLNAPVPGERQFISAVDALLLAQLSGFDQPDLSEPSLETNGDGRSIPSSSVSSSSTCRPVPPTNTGPW